MPARPLAAAAAALAAGLVAACGDTSAVTPGRGPLGIVVVTSAGSAMVDGGDDVTPTLDLRVSAGRPLDPSEVAAVLDGRRLAVRSASGGAVTAAVAAMPLGSAHRLDLDVATQTRQIAFHVVDPAGAMAALHDDARDGTVLDIAFSLAPSRPDVETALPPGTAPTWLDDRHLRAAWPRAPGGRLLLRASLPTARGSHLAADLGLDLGAVAPATLRAATVPAPPAALRSGLLVVGFSVGTAASRASVAAHADQMSLDSPTGVQARANGDLTGQPDPPTVAEAAAHGLPVWPLVQNRGFDSDAVSALLHDEGAVGHLVDGLRALAAAGGFPGIHLDFESVPPDDRDRLTGLVTRLAAALHADGRRLAVAVVPHKPGHLNYYSGAYDLGAIAHAADLVTVMAYEEHGAATDPGPVAGLDWVGEVLDGTLGSLTPSRTLLGLPVYSRSWGPSGADADSYDSSAAGALASPGARVDEDFAGRTLLVHSADGSVTYLEDAGADDAAAALAPRRSMAGVAMWRLGFEDPALWALLPARAARR